VNTVISIVVPAKDEEQNIGVLLSGIKSALKQLEHEVIVVDDSTDRTAEVASVYGARVIPGQGCGLGQAILDGIASSSGDVIVVMDADLSHDPTDLLGLLAPILLQGYDMTIGSRWVGYGGTVNWSPARILISKVASQLAWPVTRIKDATSGFFAFKAELIDRVVLYPTSWKIMLEILVKANPTTVREVPIIFRDRTAGESKFNREQMKAYLKHLLLLTLWKGRRFVKFCIVGGTGAVITFGLTWFLTEIASLWYIWSLAFAVAVAMVWNFTLNALWTFGKGKQSDEADYDWHAYYKGNIIQRWWKKRLASKVANIANHSSGNILDFGCGSSPICTLLNGQQYLGLDINEQKIEYMKDKYLPNKVFKVSGFEELEHQAFNDPKIQDTFDTVMCIETIEHLPDYTTVDRLLSCFNKLLKVGGTAIIATPNYDSRLWRVIEKCYGVLMPQAYADGHSIRFNEKLLVELANKAGLVHEETQTILGADMVCKFRKLG